MLVHNSVTMGILPLVMMDVMTQHVHLKMDGNVQEMLDHNLFANLFVEMELSLEMNNATMCLARILMRTSDQAAITVRSAICIIAITKISVIPTMTKLLSVAHQNVETD